MTGRTAIFAIAACCATMSLLAGNVCTWTGAGGDAKWSNAANWDVLPVSSNGDTVVFTNTDEVVCVNDCESFSLSRLYCSGSGKVTFAGGENAGEIKFALNGTSFTNKCNVVFNVPVRIANNVTFLFDGGAIFNGEIAIQGSYTLYFNKKDTIIPVIAVNGGVTGENATFSVRIGRNGALETLMTTDPPFLANSRIRVKAMRWAGDYKNVYAFVMTPGSEWQTGYVGYGCCFAGCENAYATNMVMSWDGYYASASGIWDLNGFNQTIDHIWSTYYPTNSSGVLFGGGDRISSDQPALLSMRATGDGRCWGVVQGQVSIAWDPVDPSRVMDFDNRVHTTTGDLIVKGGTMKVSREGSFASARNIRVCDGAVFDLDSTATGALAGAQNLVIEGSGIFKVASTAATPFSGVRVWMDAGSKLYVPSGTTLAVGSLSIGGTSMGDDTYSGIGWIDGGGSVTVDSSLLAAKLWTRPVDGNISDNTKWSDGVAPSSSEPIVLDADGAGHTVTADDATSVTGPITIGGSAVFAPAGAFTQTGGELFVNSGGKLDLPAGRDYVFTSNTAWRDPTVSMQIAGGEIGVRGGSFTADPFYGRFVVGGSSSSTRGCLSVSDGIFTICPWQSGAGAQNQQTMRVRGGGFVDVSGNGVFFCKAYGWGTVPLLLEGGEISVSGNGKFQVNGQTQTIGGYGKIVFSGNSAFTREASTQNTGISFSARGIGRTLEMIFNGRSTFDIGGEGSVIIQKGVSASKGKYTGSGVTLTLDSEASHKGAAVTYVGAYYGPGVLNMKRGLLSIGGQGLMVGVTSAGATDKNLGPDGTVNLSGGAINISGSWATVANASYLSGVIVGSSLPVPASSIPDGCNGRIFIGGGSITNQNGCVIAGVGTGVGRITMTNGVFFSAANNTSVNVLGFLNGTGLWTQTGGTAVFSNAVHVGGAELSNLPNAANLSVGSTVDTSSAKGVLDVSGGSFETKKQLILGAKGTGQLVVGGTGVVCARDLVVSNSTSSVTIVADGRGVGCIRLTGDINVAEGTELTIDATDYAVDSTTRGVDVLTYATASRPFSEIVLKGNANRLQIVQKPGKIRLCPFRGITLTIR